MGHSACFTYLTPVFFTSCTCFCCLFFSMESSSLVSDFLSPESTITSLLSSSGHLRSSLLIPEHNATFSYRDKVHTSTILSIAFAGTALKGHLKMNNSYILIDFRVMTQLLQHWMPTLQTLREVIGTESHWQEGLFYLKVHHSHQGDPEWTHSETEMVSHHSEALSLNIDIEVLTAVMSNILQESKKSISLKRGNITFSVMTKPRGAELLSYVICILSFTIIW